MILRYFVSDVMALNNFKMLFALTLVALINIERSCGSDFFSYDIQHEYRVLRKMTKDSSNLNSTHYLWKVLSLYHKIQPKTLMKTNVICVNNTPSIDYDDLRIQSAKVLDISKESAPTLPLTSSFFAKYFPDLQEWALKEGKKELQVIDLNALNFSEDILNAAKRHPVYYLLTLKNSTIEEYLNLKNTRHFAHFEKIEKATNIHYEALKDTWWTEGHYYQYDKEQWLLYTFHQTNLSWLLSDTFCNQSFVMEFLDQSMIDYDVTDIQPGKLRSMMDSTFDNGYKNVLFAESVFSNPFKTGIYHGTCDFFLPESSYFQSISTIDELRRLQKYVITHYCVFSISLIANILVIASIVTMKKMTKNDILRLSLAITDLVTVLAVLTVTTLELRFLSGYIKLNSGGFYNEFQEDNIFPGYKSSYTQLEKEFDLHYKNAFYPPGFRTRRKSISFDQVEKDSIEKIQSEMSEEERRNFGYSKLTSNLELLSNGYTFGNENSTGYYFPGPAYCVKEDYSFQISRINIFVLNATTSVSLYNITFMAIFKLYAFKSPWKNTRLSRKKVAIITMFCAWIVPIAVVTGISLIAINDSGAWYFFLIGIIFYYILPFFIASISYIALWINLRKRTEKRKALIAQSKTQARSKSSKSARFMKIISLILLGYTVTFAPFVILYFDFGAIYSQTFNSLYQFTYGQDRVFFFTVLYSNTLVDVFVYGAYDDRFREFMKTPFIRLKKLFRCPDNVKNSKTKENNDVIEMDELQGCPDNVKNNKKEENNDVIEMDELQGINN